MYGSISSTAGEIKSGPQVLILPADGSPGIFTHWWFIDVEMPSQNNTKRNVFCTSCQGWYTYSLPSKVFLQPSWNAFRS